MLSEKDSDFSQWKINLIITRYVGTAYYRNIPTPIYGTLLDTVLLKSILVVRLPVRLDLEFFKVLAVHL
jgi:hypothetical protein